MLKMSCVCAALLLACIAGSAFAAAAAPQAAASTDASLSTTASTDSSLSAPASSGKSDPVLDGLLARMDAAAKNIKTLQAHITITTRENFSGRETPRSGRLYIRKPDDLFLDLTKPYPHKTWITASEIVDYRPDLNSGDRFLLSADGAEKPQVIGLSTTAAEMKKSFTITLAPPGTKSAQYVLTIVPMENVKTDFTSAEVTIDATTLLPVIIVQKNEPLDETKTFSFTSTKENPRLSDDVFKPRFAPNADIQKHKSGDWKGP